MKFGVHIFPTDESIEVAALAAEAEARGIESLWLPEHTHIPASRESEWYRGRELPREYSRTLDPFVALTSAAAVTRRIKLGTGVCLVAQHDPITLAKTVATLDRVTGGRFQFGVGLGWNLEEMRDHGVEPSTRRSAVREKVLAMQGLWAKDTFAFEGRFVRFAESWSWPKPLQSPRPPVHLGGRGGARAFQHIAEFADGWMPDISMIRREALGAMIDELALVCESAGRDPAEVAVSAVGVRPDPEQFARMSAAGAVRCICLLPSAGRDEVLPVLDTIHDAIARAGLATEETA
ncbi:MAG TPA: LLM class F420-dependent oxidoreductase [Amycolatopsis sp.]|nr:LLM class F420-dependent oxidoreductase [Amycolatopsis sp.]